MQDPAALPTFPPVRTFRDFDFHHPPPGRLPMPRTVSPLVSMAAATVAVASALAAAPSGASAQTPGLEPAVVEIPASTRAMGLGGAYQVGMPDSDVLFYNPALLDRAGGSLTGGVHVIGEGSLGFTTSAARSWFGGDVGLGLQVLEYGWSEPGSRPGGLDPLATPEGRGVTEMVATAGLSRRIFGVRVGVSGKILAQRFHDFRQTSGAVDVGVAHQIGPIMAGFAVRDIGPDRTVTEEGETSQPTRVTLGLGGYGQRLGPLDVGLASALTLRDDGELIAGGGLEVGYWPVVGRTFVARIGAETVPEGDASPLTLGASYWGDELVLTYAWRSVGDAGSVHRVGLGWR